MKKSKLHAKTRHHGIFDSLVTSLTTFLWPVANDLRRTAPARSWIEATFHKRECSRYIHHTKDPLRCCCGRLLEQHKSIADTQPPQPGELWYPSKCTIASPTDAYGILEFQGGPHPSKAQYIRVAHDTKPEYLMQLITREWNLELPKLLISVQGGKANFELQPKLKKVLRKGLLKAARSTGAWIFTGGTNTGVTKHVGDALLLERSQRTGRVNTLGIAPWGIVENNQDLIGQHTEVPYHSISSPRSKNAALNNRHAYFLLVDNGTVGKYGAEIILRRKLEKYISKQRLYPFTQSPIPIVCLVIEGGTNTIRAVLEYVTDEPPVPVVVCDGSGRAADIIAFMCKYECSVLKSMKEYIIATIQRAFEVAAELAEGLFTELMQCVENKHLITVFRIADKYDQKPQELDQIILTALFKSQHLSPTEQLSLALTWNRADIARSEIFVYGQEWPPGALEDAMIKALEHDRCDFVKLLLENGVSMRKFLTIPRLENLYNSKQGPSNTLGYILRDVRPHIPPGYVYTLHDIGLVINKLMGGAYRALYTRRKFRPIYAKIMNKGHSMANTSGRNLGALGLIPGCIPGAASPCLFDYPFNELLIWAVLMKRHKMALLMWQHGEEALAKSLVACKLYKAMAHEAAEDDMETEVYEELRAYGKEFENIALEVLDYCYRQDDDQTQQLLTCELQNWSGHTCLSLAVSANHRALLAHPCSQIILADLWMGGLRTRKNTNIKVILGLLCMPYIFKLEFKSKEELQLMPQTTEEHMELENDDDDKSDSEKNQDGDVSCSKPSKTLALLTENFITRDTVVQQNGGKLIPDFDDEKFKQLNKGRELKMKKKLYEFYTAPITKFWSNSIAYLAFLVLFSFTILVKMEHVPNWQEVFSTAFILSLGCEKLRELFSSEPVGMSQKFAVWSWNMWNPSDMAAVFMFMVGMSLRYQSDQLPTGRVIYCTNCIYWYLRILNILSVNKYLGPLVTMMGKMVKNMIYFIVLLLIILMSFGVARQAILKPNQPPTWSLARDVFFEPYFMLYGEVFADEIDPPCGGDDEEVCVPGRWISPVIMSMYLLVANILLINLLIAVFNNIFNEVNAIAHQVWMFQRFTVVMEYEQKPLLPPPFIVFSHLYLVVKYFRRKLEGVEESYDNGLKLFLDKDEMERLYDFEEDCVEGYFAEQENKLQQSTEERIKITTERIEHLTQKVEDIISKENLQTTVLQNLDVRTRRYTDQIQDLINDVDMVKQLILQNQMYPTDPIITAQHAMRQRTISEQSELSEDNTIVGHLLPQNIPPHRKKTVLRSLTEVRPDAYIFDNGQHIEYRYADEEDETEQLDNISMAGSTQQLNVLRQRTRSTESKESSESDKKNDDVLIDDVVGFNSDILRARASQYRRDSTGTIRRGSESGTGFRKRNASEMSNPEIALNLEKEHLRNAEESDYMVMENLIQRRYSEEDEDIDDDVIERPSSRNPALLKVVTETREFRLNSWPVRNALLKRSSAVEELPTPIGHLGSSGSSTDRQDSTESSDNTAAINQLPMPQRPSIVIDSSQLPTIQREALPTAGSKGSLHMQSETMC